MPPMPAAARSRRWQTCGFRPPRPVATLRPWTRQACLEPTSSSRACAAHFIPELPGWRDRSPFVLREGSIDFHRYDFHAQAPSKIERAHARDVSDVREMAARGLIDPARLLP